MCTRYSRSVSSLSLGSLWMQSMKHTTGFSKIRPIKQSRTNLLQFIMHILYTFSMNCSRPSSWFIRASYTSSLYCYLCKVLVSVVVDLELYKHTWVIIVDLSCSIIIHRYKSTHLRCELFIPYLSRAGRELLEWRSSRYLQEIRNKTWEFKQGDHVSFKVTVDVI